MPSKTNLTLATLASILFSYIVVISINIINPPQIYKQKVLSAETSAPISVEIKNTKLMGSSQTLYETNILITTTAPSSVGFWYQGPSNPYGTSMFEDSTVPLKKDHTFHITALPAGTYEYFAVSFDNQNQKPAYTRFPTTGTNQMYIGTSAPSPTPSQNIPYIPYAD